MLRPRLKLYVNMSMKVKARKCVCAYTNVWVEKETNLSTACVTTELAWMLYVPGCLLAHQVAELMDWLL